MRLEVDELLQIASTRDARIAPDGGTLAFCAVDLDRDADCEHSEVRIVSLDADRYEEELFAAPGALPRWSPGGDALAFLAATADPDRVVLRLLRLTDGVAADLCAFAAPVGPPVFSPRNDAIAIAAAAEPAGESRIAVVPVQGGELTWIESEEGSADRDPAFSPRDERIAFTRGRDGDASGGPTSGLRLATRGRSGSAPIETGLAYAVAPSWSPDGATIACVGTAERRLGGQDPALRVWTLPAGGGTACPAAADDEGVVTAPVLAPPQWSADGERLLYRLARAGEIRVVAARPGGGPVESLTEGSQVLDFSYASATEALACTVLGPREPGAIELIEPTGRRRLAAGRGAWAASRAAAIPLPLRRRFGDDRRPLDGWVQGIDSSRAPQPLLLALHGGPHGYFGPGFQLGHFYRNVLASRGWVVLTLNATGSGSYGCDFADAIRGAWGERDLPEHQAALAELLDEGVADPDRLAVAGYSYGGYLATWAAAHDDRFRAAVVGAPIVDLVSFERSSDIGLWYTPWQMRGGLLENRERYERLSALTHAAAITAPVLLLHGDADRRVPIEQGEALRRRLERDGRATVEMIRFAGADHLFYAAGRPSQRLEFNRRIVEWLEAHVNGGGSSDG